MDRDIDKEWTWKRQGMGHEKDRETNAVNRMVIYIANSKAKDIANKKPLWTAPL
jgi:hypothetical protein